MNNEAILEKINSLPLDLQKEVEDFIDFLKTRVDQKRPEKRKLGLLKGKIRMSDDFDEPLEEFKDYM
ncbi:MAG: DUF2281 domain-containing protein [Bacteroidia bacterium]